MYRNFTLRHSCGGYLPLKNYAFGMILGSKVILIFYSSCHLVILGLDPGIHSLCVLT